MKSMQRSKTKRLLELDSARGIAALFVVLFHYTYQYDKTYGHTNELWFSFPMGKYGVELFFIISGFVIFMSLERTKKSLDFVVSRFSRLYPAYWASVVLTFSITYLYKLSSHSIAWHYIANDIYSFFVNLTMFQVFLGVKNLDGSYWTLGVEISFYIIMFTLFKTGLLKYIDLISTGWLFLLAIAVLLMKSSLVEIDPKLITIVLLGKPHLSVYANLFIAGIMLYKMNAEGFSLKRQSIIAGCLLIYKLQHTLLETLLVAAIILLFKLMLDGKLAFLRRKFFLFLGAISYTLYLIHQEVGFVIIRILYQFNVNPNIILLITTSLCILIASSITFWVEKPVMFSIREKYNLLSKQT
jgi:peptidoglycan/LPS O-acetylase OafA/YrhL